MANPTDVTSTGPEPFLMQVTETNAEVALDPNREYSLLHTSLDAAGAEALEVVYVGRDSAVAALTMAAGTNKFPLPAGVAVTIGPNWTSLHLAIAEAAQNVMVAVVPSQSRFGRW